VSPGALRALPKTVNLYRFAYVAGFLPPGFDYAEVQRWAAQKLALGKTGKYEDTVLFDPNDTEPVPRALQTAVRRFFNTMSYAVGREIRHTYLRVRYETDQLLSEDYGWHRNSVRSSFPEYANSSQLIVYLSEPVTGTEWTHDDIGTPNSSNDTCELSGHSSKTCSGGIGSALYFDQRLRHRRPAHTALPRLTLLVSLSLAP